MRWPGRCCGRGAVLAAALVLIAGADNNLSRAEVGGPARAEAAPGRPDESVPRASAWMALIAPSQTPGFSTTLEQRLAREAQRRGSFLTEFADPDDDAAVRGRARSAQRIFTRALRGTLDDQVGSLARGNPAFGRALAWLDGFGIRTSGRGSMDAPEALPAPGAAWRGQVAAAPPRSRFDAGMRMRLDAHPSLELRARAGSLTGLIEVPLLEREVRVGIEQPLGKFGKAAFRGGRSEGQGDWADFVVGLRF